MKQKVHNADPLQERLKGKRVESRELKHEQNAENLSATDNKVQSKAELLDETRTVQPEASRYCRRRCSGRVIHSEYLTRIAAQR